MYVVSLKMCINLNIFSCPRRGEARVFRVGGGVTGKATPSEARRAESGGEVFGGGGGR